MMSDDYDIDAVTDGLGNRYRIMDKLSLKPFPSIGQVHAPVDAVREILETEDLEADDVTDVVVRTTLTVKDHVGWDYEPTDVMSAQSNIQYAIGALLVDGGVAIEAYTEDAIRRPALLEWINDITIVADESLKETTFGSIVEVSTADGTYENSVHTPRGYPSNFLHEEEIRQKFRTQTEKAVSDKSVESLISLISNLEDLENVCETTRHC